MSVEASLVLLPRFTTLAGATTFRTVPVDVSSYGGAQFQVWRGPFRTSSGTPTPTFKVQFEESLDTQSWALGPSIPGTYDVGEYETKFFSYSFRLRWFRLAVIVAGTGPLVTCWAEGILRGGGGGVWGPATTYDNAAAVRSLGSGTPRQLSWSEAQVAARERAHASGTADLDAQTQIANLMRFTGQGWPFG